MNIKSRLKNLEATAASKRHRPLCKMVMLPCDTREATDRRIAEANAKAEANGTEVFIFEPVPATDESVNDWRQREGLQPMDIPGWNERKTN